MEEIIMKEGKVAVLDFEGVRGITHTFADEIVGIFTRVVNANENVRRILNLAVKIALKHREKSVQA